MQIVSFAFLLFFAVTVLGYYLLPVRVRYIWLFAASLFFYFSQGPFHAVFLFFSVLTTWLGALFLNGKSRGGRRGILAGIVAVNLADLLYFKYIGFFSGGRIVSPILPIGISFYLFQSVGYLIDVYRGTIPPEKDPIRYALFVSF